MKSHLLSRITPSFIGWSLRAIAALPVLLITLTLVWNHQALTFLASQLTANPTGVFKTLGYGLPMIGWAFYGAALWVGATVVGRLRHRKVAWEGSLAVSGGLLASGSLFQLLWTSHALHMWMYYSGPLPAHTNISLQALLCLIALIGILMAAASLRIHRMRSELDQIV